jgi:hypothetical protein
MSLFSANCRCIGKASAVRELRDFVTNFSPSILCIHETQISRVRVESLDNSLCFDQGFAVVS